MRIIINLPAQLKEPQQILCLVKRMMKMSKCEVKDAQVYTNNDYATDDDADREARV